MTQSFASLVTATCAHLGFNEPQRIIDGESIYLNDVAFSMIHDANVDPLRVFVFAIFGDMPVANRTAVLEQLLLENHTSYAEEGPGFTVSPATGRVSYCMRVRLDKMTPQELAKRIAYLTHKAAEWRKTFFLKEGAATTSEATTSSASSTARRLNFIHSRT